MIDFRYHLVSIIAVFLALAVGLVVGATAPRRRDRGHPEQAADRAEQARTAICCKDKQALSNQVSADQTFAAGGRAEAAARPADRARRWCWSWRPAPTAPVTTGVTTALHQAGATVTGDGHLSSSVPGHQRAERGHTDAAGAEPRPDQAGVPLPTRSSSPVGGQQAAAQVLAATPADPDGGTGLSSGRQPRNPDRPSASHGYLSIGSSGSQSGRPLSAVLVTPGGVAAADGQRGARGRRRSRCGMPGSRNRDGRRGRTRSEPAA